MPKFFAHGAGLTFNGSAVGGLLDIPLPENEAEEIEETDMDSAGWREWRAGLKDGGTIELLCRRIPGDAGQDALVTALGGDAEAVVITAPGGTGEPQWTFNAAVLKAGGGTLYWEGQVADFTATLRVSGEVTEGTQPA